MESRDGTFWAKTVSPELRKLVPGVTADVSRLFVEHVPIEDCGDFFWAVQCIARWAPAEQFEQYRTDFKLPPREQANALLSAAVGATDFYDCPAGAIARLLERLGQNALAAKGMGQGQEVEDAHMAALERVRHLVIYLAVCHPEAEKWLSRPPKTQAKPRHLKLVRSA